MSTRASSRLYERWEPYVRKHGDLRSDAAIDRDRVIHSSAFRRLQGKTQIVGVQTHGFVRTRLTHSLECAQIGRSIANRLHAAPWGDVVERREDLVDLVETVCLAHDLGHPPFGHNGEEELDRRMGQHGLSFEGNAQSFRIVTLLEPKKLRLAGPDGRPVGLNLTRSTLQAMCKYPFPEPGIGGKYGVYDDRFDSECFAWLWGGETAPMRTLGAEILEASDDIAYAVHDVEDGVWANLVPLNELVADAPRTLEQLIDTATSKYPTLFDGREQVEREVADLLAPLRDDEWARQRFDGTRPSEEGLKGFCSQLTHELITSVTEGGRLCWADNLPLQRRIATLKSLVWTWMIDRPSLVTRRHGQRRVVRELFEGYWEEPEMLPHLDDWHRARYDSDAHKARLICDHIAAMTDAYVVRVHREMFDPDWSAQLDVF